MIPLPSRSQHRWVSRCSASFPVPTTRAGVFRLEGNALAGDLDCARPDFTKQRGFAQPDDVALTLHTSGSTSQPRAVPLTHLNLCHSARSIGASLNLAAGDRCLNIVSLFHVHGLISALLSSLEAGASIVCTPGFNAANLSRIGSTSSGQPGMQQRPRCTRGFWSRAATKSDVISRSRLRCVSSGRVPVRHAETHGRVGKRVSRSGSGSLRNDGDGVHYYLHSSASG